MHGTRDNLRPSSFESLHHSKLAYAEAYEPKPFGRYDADFNKGRPPGTLVAYWHGRRLTDEELFARIAEEGEDAGRHRARLRRHRFQRDGWRALCRALGIRDPIAPGKWPERPRYAAGLPHASYDRADRVMRLEAPRARGAIRPVRVHQITGRYDPPKLVRKRLAPSADWLVWSDGTVAGNVSPWPGDRVRGQVIQVIVPGRSLGAGEDPKEQEAREQEAKEKRDRAYASAWGHKPAEELGKPPFDWREPQPAAGKPIMRVTIEIQPLPERREWKELERWKLDWWWLVSLLTRWAWSEEKSSRRFVGVRRVKPDGWRSAPAVRDVYDMFQNDVEQIDEAAGALRVGASIAAQDEVVTAGRRYRRDYWVLLPGGHSWPLAPLEGEIVYGSMFYSPLFHQAPTEFLFLNGAWFPQPDRGRDRYEIGTRYRWETATWSWASKEFPYPWDTIWHGRWITNIWEYWSEPWAPALPRREFGLGRKPMGETVDSALTLIGRLIEKELPPPMAARAIEVLRQLNRAFEVEEALAIRGACRTYAEAVRRLADMRGLSDQ